MLQYFIGTYGLFTVLLAQQSLKGIFCKRSTLTFKKNCCNALTIIEYFKVSCIFIYLF